MLDYWGFVGSRAARHWQAPARNCFPAGLLCTLMVRASVFQVQERVMSFITVSACSGWEWTHHVINRT